MTLANGQVTLRAPEQPTGTLHAAHWLDEGVLCVVDGAGRTAMFYGQPGATQALCAQRIDWKQSTLKRVTVLW